jgi:hypothetical protein
MDQDELKAAEEAFAGGYDDKPTERPVVEEPKPDAEAKPQDEPKPEADAPKEEDKPAAKPDPLAEVLARMDKMQQSHDRLAGTLGSVQQQMQANLAAAKAATGQVADAPGQADIKRAVADPAEWEALKRDFPEWGLAVEGLLEARLPKFDANAFEQKVTEAIEGKAKAMQTQIIDASLTAVFPGWKQDVASTEFKAWMDAQPEDIQKTRYSDDVGDVARTLNLYAKHKADAAAQKAAADAEQANKGGKKDTSAREKRLAAAVIPKGTGGHAPGRTELDEFEAGYTG